MSNIKSLTLTQKTYLLNELLWMKNKHIFCHACVPLTSWVCSLSPSLPLFLSLSLSLCLCLSLSASLSPCLSLSLSVCLSLSRTLGTPNNDIWPEVESLPDYKNTFPKWKAGNLAAMVKNLDKNGLDLLAVSNHGDDGVCS